jgi:hypothetical protein
VKFLFVIPALMLFLSNVPLVHKMDMKQMMAAMKKNGCCKKKAEPAPACHNTGEMPAEKPSCNAPGAEEPSHHACNMHGHQQDNDKKAGKCAKQDTTCVCICCFQYAAPGQVAAKLQFGLAEQDNGLAGYVQQNWKNPHLTGPWQPPDVI